MAKNCVQFQPGLSLQAFLAGYGSEGQCEHALEAARWPDGFVCPRYAGQRSSKFHRHMQALLAVLGLSPPEQSTLGNGVRAQPIAADDLAIGNVSGEPEQDESIGAGIDESHPFNNVALPVLGRSNNRAKPGLGLRGIARGGITGCI
jgi:hypothetical protein